MKFLKLFFVLSILAVIIFETFFMINYWSVEKKVIENNIESHINDILILRSFEIENFIKKIKTDLDIFSSLNEVQNIFQNGLKKDPLLLEKTIKAEVDLVSEDVLKYFKINPNESLKELKEDEYFRKIAIQQVGNTGYTVINNKENAEIQIHPNLNFVDTNINQWKDSLPEIWELLEESKYENEVSGYYDWIEANGERKRKFAYIKNLNYTTIDSVKLGIAATTYVDEYKFYRNISNDIDIYFKKYLKENDFKDILFIDLNGTIGYSISKESDIGTNLNTGQFRNSNLAKAYRKSKDLNKITLSEYDYYRPSFELALFVIAPVYHFNEVVGFVAFQIREEEINLLVNQLFISKNEDIYLVNSKFMLVTPSKSLKGKNKGVLTQEIKTENSIQCFENSSNFLVHSNNFLGNDVFAGNSRINFLEWCLLVEMDKDIFLDKKLEDNFKKDFLKSIIFSIIFIIFFCFIAILLDKYFKIKKNRRKK